MRRHGDTTSATIVPSARCVPEPPGQRAYRAALPRNGAVARSIIVGGAIVEISGDPANVTYDPQTDEAVITVGRTVVRVKKKP